MELIPLDPIAQRILLIRGHRVMLDSDLAEIYEVPAKRLNEQVRRNIKRFPPDFMFQLTPEEFTSLRSQNATLKIGRGQHRKYLPYAFTEQGVAMLSGVLNSERAIDVNVAIMRA
ncbi:MAG TPA: ORF6N domain-containing protein, partial [Thermodesulfobacteriota bacterium]|nr:ORF6N domain-containing protein [Thermodesulfobacteriota bacterium]